MNVKRLGQALLAGTVLALASGGAWAGIAATKHNLSDAGLGTQTNSFSGTDEICVFCHTPHGAAVDPANDNPPLWNRILPASSTFTTYDSLGSTTLDGEVLGVGSVSIACLSCHDGTQAMNVMINAPGSGNFDNVNGFNLAGTWTGPASTATPVGSLNYASVVNLGQDLTNDHPIGIEYAGGGCEGVPALTCSPAGGDTADADFQDATRTATGVNQWFVDVTGSAAGRDKTDMILYTRTFAAGVGPSVECASCHDPHTDVNPTFLRTSNAQSAVCLACHIK